MMANGRPPTIHSSPLNKEILRIKTLQFCSLTVLSESAIEKPIVSK